MEKIIEYILNDKIIFGIIFILLSFMLLAIRIYFKEPTRMKEHSAASWKSYVNSWAFIILTFILGLSLLLN